MQKNYSVNFDSHFSRPCCLDCEWLPIELTMRATNLFEPCDHCWGYPELRDMWCDKCNNEGKVLNSLGEEVKELILDMKDFGENSNG